MEGMALEGVDRIENGVFMPFNMSFWCSLVGSVDEAMLADNGRLLRRSKELVFPV